MADAIAQEEKRKEERERQAKERERQARKWWEKQVAKEVAAEKYAVLCGSSAA